MIAFKQEALPFDNSMRHRRTKMQWKRLKQRERINTIMPLALGLCALMIWWFMFEIFPLEETAAVVIRYLSLASFVGGACATSFLYGASFYRRRLFNNPLELERELLSFVDEVMHDLIPEVCPKQDTDGFHASFIISVEQVASGGSVPIRESLQATLNCMTAKQLEMARRRQQFITLITPIVKAASQASSVDERMERWIETIGTEISRGKAEVETKISLPDHSSGIQAVTSTVQSGTEDQMVAGA